MYHIRNISYIFTLQAQTARWPSFFKDHSFRLKEKVLKKWFDLKIDDVNEIPKQQYDSKLRNWNQNEYVLVYKYSPKSLHSVYVEKYDASTKMVDCINSHGPKDQRPTIRLQDIVKLYIVTCTAVPGTTVRKIELRPKL